MATVIALRFRVNSATTIQSYRLIKSFSFSGPNTLDEENSAESPPPSQTSIVKSRRHPPQQQQQYDNRADDYLNSFMDMAASLSEFRSATERYKKGDPVDPETSAKKAD
jgi:hypothetical protein